MSYSFLGHDLHTTADRAKKWFAHHLGATKFICEQPVMDLPLRPTWQAALQGGYSLCVNVQSSPFSPTLYAFVNQCAQRGLPIKLFVVIGSAAPRDNFAAELKQAREAGVGVLQIPDDGEPNEFHHAMPLSLCGLTRIDPKHVPKARREIFKTAHDAFLDGNPGQGCQLMCQELEDISRKFAFETHQKGWWRQPQGKATLKPNVFLTDAWAALLELMEERANVAVIRGKAPLFSKQLVVRTRAHTDWRNDVSHKPKTTAALKARDKRLRTMFETTSHLVLEWYDVAKPLRLVK